METRRTATEAEAAWSKALPSHSQWDAMTVDVKIKLIIIFFFAEFTSGWEFARAQLGKCSSIRQRRRLRL